MMPQDSAEGRNVGSDHSRCEGGLCNALRGKRVALAFPGGSACNLEICSDGTVIAPEATHKSRDFLMLEAFRGARDARTGFP